jgi:hypothetical protein
VEWRSVSKFAGLTLPGIYVDLPEEIPQDFDAALRRDLSQPESTK